MGKNNKPTNKIVLKLSHSQAANFFLKDECYSNVSLPPYFSFTKLLKEIDNEVKKSIRQKNKAASSYSHVYQQIGKARHVENVNHTIFANKDGRYSWRRNQLINPVIYVALVREITKKDNWAIIKKRFKEFSKNKNIECSSISPVPDNNRSSIKEQILSWKEKFEHRTLELSLNFSFMVYIDISNCYSSIYTHSIAWALHGKNTVKNDKYNRIFLGNRIDNFIQNASYGQTNGIPEGSILMDFIAEMVLGYADYEFNTKTKNIKYKILRYRDDYRIFTNSSKDAEKILKILSEVLLDVGLRINSSKTIVSQSIITDALKPEKVYWNNKINFHKNFLTHMLIIHDLAEKYPNSGILISELESFSERIQKPKRIIRDVLSLIAVATDIAYGSPRTYPVYASIISKLMDAIDNDKEKKKIIDSIKLKFENIPNTSHLFVWLQRITICFDETQSYDDKLCNMIEYIRINKQFSLRGLWDIDWLENNFQSIFDNNSIIDIKAYKRLKLISIIRKIEYSHYNY